MPGLALDTPDAVERVRLHITPFNSELLDKILAPSVKAQADNISFHTVQTFPDRGFGYVELPAMEAEKLRKKLNGSTLRGSKVRVEAAKAEKKRGSDAEVEEDDGESTTPRVKKVRKRAEQDVLPGHELEDGRHIKRGWMEKSSRKSRRKPSGSDGDLESKSLLFKTAVPPNASPLDMQTKDKKKARKSKDEKKSKKKVVVEEFSKSYKPEVHDADTAAGAHVPMSYEDGKGWVAEDGDVVDPEPPARRRKSKRESEPRVSAVQSQDTRDVADSLPPDEPVASDTCMIIDASTEGTKEVHPLEALFKRPASKTSDDAKPRPKPIDTSFSLFDVSTAANEEDDDEGGEVDMPPQTPHTRRDLEWRSIRSAAPTPDTAALGRHFSFPSDDRSDEDDDVDMQNEAEPEQPNDGEEGAQHREGESAFRKWFYENRGDLNRGWKKRRREEKKVLRQRESRRLSSKIA
ncbi:hypothetical protein BDY17DRAFT_314734 [Neohortaea acidophila]|uniref:RRM domain-containing protein n=1 Tax=Neohortaea acidophila TaxID=245834 RepID=A0A6A6Q7G1_9PEZI|nr:uncharacterized protein BDY17DRAFT_314734 [Neohortaea acidophila]KAF2487934.1 hypothetical protein BDY17DRAFT_314734 [Neohortaea acidophila]